MDMTITLAGLALAAALTVFFGWMGAKPPNLVRGPRLMPYRLLMVFSAAATVLMVVHVLNLMGVATGQPDPPPLP